MPKAPPQSVGKTRARRVFGDVAVDTDARSVGSNSLTYSPSPVVVRKSPRRNIDDASTSSAKGVLFGTQSTEKENTDETLSFTNSSTTLSVAAAPPSPKATSRVENIPDRQKEELRRLRKQSRSPKRRDLVKRTQEAIHNATTSVNESLNAVRRAKSENFDERARETAKQRDQWREEKEEAREFYTQAEKNRRELLALQRQLSSKFVQAKAQRDMDDRRAYISAIDQESQFKSQVFRDHQKSLKEEQDRKRRQSVEARRKVRLNNREGEAKLRLARVEEDHVLVEERHLSSLAWRTSKQNVAEQRRKSFQFRNGDARRIRELHARMESDRFEQEHQSFELKMAGERDADAYQKRLLAARRDSFASRNERGKQQREKMARQAEEARMVEHGSVELRLAGERDADAYRRQVAQERRDSLASRNRQGYRQRQEADLQRSEEQQIEHANYALKWAGERDAEAYRIRMDEDRRESYAFRNKEGQRQREQANIEHAQQLQDEHESYELKWAGERDGDAYRTQMEEERRSSYAFRNKEGHRLRQTTEDQQSAELQANHQSYELKWAGERDADAYRKQLEQERRDSYAFGNKEGRRHRLEASLQHSYSRQAEHASYELKWDGERDADSYRRQLEQERRDSFAFRNEEGHRQRQEAQQLRSHQLHAEHESYQLKWSGERDADAYRAQMKQERRDSFKLRNEERAKHQKVMAELQFIAREQETESLVLKWAGQNDAKAYLAQLEEKRRQSYAFRNEEGRRHRDLAAEEQQQYLLDAQADEALKSAARQDVLAYEAENAARDRASLLFRRKEAFIQRLEEEEQRQEEYQLDQENRKLEDAARGDVEGYLKDCKERRRLSLAFRAKEKRNHSEWKRREADRRLAQQSRDTRDRAADRRNMEAARQQERSRIALDALRHAGCTFAVNPFAGIMD